MKQIDSKYFGYLVIALIVAYAGFNFFKNKYALSNCAKYSLATPNKIKCTGKTGTCSFMTYSFYYNNEKIEGEDGIEHNLRENNTDIQLLSKKYFVKFNCANPHISEICWEVSVLVNDNDVPPNGWDKIPYGLDKSK